MNRIVRQINEKAEGAEQKPGPFSAFSEAPNIVLLGDPGAGKSHLFEKAAASEAGRYVKARAFLVMPPATPGEVVFIDALDERRAGRSDRDTVDALVAKLFVARPAKVRISCRAADWLGESDLAALRPYFELTAAPVVLVLEALSLDEQCGVLVANGCPRSDAEAFLQQAHERGLDEFLQNPQNLLMLFEVVRGGNWPSTRSELFQRSTGLMLREINQEHTLAGGGVYSGDELRPVAGAICAAGLISDIEAVSLLEQEGTSGIPGYRSLTFFDAARTQAALGRRIFAAGPLPGTVSYTHRTTAEFLGAAWLADLVRSGLPFGRLIALLGVDGQPAPELRGLHAWLAVHLPEYAGRLIDGDPYGVVTYGDVAALPALACAHLIRALARLSQTNPWFRSGNWQSPGIGGLARADMIEEYRAVLTDPNAGFGIRSTILEALARGTPLPAMKDDLTAILKHEASTFAERLYALNALLRFGNDAKQSIRTTYPQLGTTSSAIRLRARIIEALYGDGFGTADVVQLLNDTLASEDEMVGGSLWGLSDAIPLHDIPEVLDGIEPLGEDSGMSSRTGWDVTAQYERLLLRAWRELPEVGPARALKWLRVQRSFSRVHTGRRGEELRAAMRDTPERLHAIADHFFDTLAIGKYSWLALNRFREAVLHQIPSDDLLSVVIAHFERAERGSPKQLFLYEIAFSLTWNASPRERECFEWLHGQADTKPELTDLRNRMMAYTLPHGYLRLNRRTPAEPAKDNEQSVRREFEKEAEAIRRGENLNGLIWTARVYLGVFIDVDHTASPRGRLVKILGEENAAIALEGLIASLTRLDVPALKDVVDLAREHQYQTFWLAVVAGVTERFAREADLGVFPDELLRAMLAFDLTQPTPENGGSGSSWVQHPWKVAAVRERPDLVRDAYLAMARSKLARGDQMVDGLRELMTDEALAPYRIEATLELLRDFPKASPYRLQELLDAVLATPGSHAEFLTLADAVVRGTRAVDQPQRDMWLAAAFVVSPGTFERAVEAAAQERPGFVFDLRNATGFSDIHGHARETPLLLPQLEFLARLTGSLHPRAGYPAGGWGGDTNPWDASDYFRSLVNTISGMPSEAATGALSRLADDRQLASYRAEVLQALANQRARRREMEYDRPDWAQTLKALSNGPPATVADLHALLVEQLGEMKKRIASENTDIYKQFWNVDSHARPADPRPEEACRDNLVTLLRPALTQLGITAEPEGHMAADKRADISVSMPGRRILCELKRDYHADVWTAAGDQLERYTRDPEAQGFGVYGVFWFGDKRGHEMPAPPGGLARPGSASEMEKMLNGRIPAERKSRIAVVVFDVSGSE
jgi:hypothetical protein